MPYQGVRSNPELLVGAACSTNKYQPPKVRAAAEAEAIKQDPSKVLTAANFPTLGRTEAPVGASAPPLNFLKRMKESEELRRQREEELARSDPAGVNGKSREALAAMGWVVLGTDPASVRQAVERLSCAAE